MRLEITRSWREGVTVIFSGYRVSAGDDGKVLNDENFGDGYTHCAMCFMSLN